MIELCQTVSDMKRHIRKKDIFCWGTGNYFLAFLDCIADTPCRISYLVDRKYSGSSRNLGGKSIPILDGKRLRTAWKAEILVITTAQYREIVKELEKDQRYEALSYIVFPALLPDYGKEAIERRSQLPLIPPVLHYCWFGRKPLPDGDRKNISGWKRLCPEFELCCWSEDNYDVRQNRYIRQAYENGQWAYLSDFVRFDILNRYGGFYFDTDVELLRNLEELRFQPAFIAAEITGSINSGAGMGSVPGQPLLEEIGDSYLEEGTWDQYPTNAFRETELLRSYGFKADNRYQVIRDVAVYPGDFFSPKQIGVKEVRITQRTYSIHHYHYSWMNTNI